MPAKLPLSALSYRAAHVVLTLVVAICLVLLATGRAHAAPVVDGEVDAKGKPGYITEGPDGNVWVVLDGSGPQGDDVAKISVGPSGEIVVEGFDVAALGGAVGIAGGPGNTLWVTKSTAVARFSPENPAGAEAFPIADLGDPRDIALGPDGNLWTGSGDKLIKIPPANPAGYETTPVAGLAARGIASDGERLWIASFGDGRIYSATTAAVVTPHDVGGGPQEVAAGKGGQVAYTNPGSDPQTVGRLTHGAGPLFTPAPGTDPFGIAFASDEAYWFAQFLTHDIGRLTADGQYTVLGGLSAGSGPRHLTAGPGNTLWVSLETAQKVARISGLEPPTAAPPAAPPANAAPVVSRLSVSPKRFRVAKGPTALTARKGGKGKRPPAGTTIRFTLSEAATVRLSIERKTSGRRRGGKCVRPTRALRRAKRCTRFVERGTLTRRNLAAGRRSVKLSGRIGRRALAPGSYRVTVVATDAAGARSAPRRASFTVVAGR